MNETINTIKGRRSIRAYKEDSVPKDMVDEIIDCGRHAPSGMNKQPWRFIVINDPKLIKELSKGIINGIPQLSEKVKERIKSKKDPIFYSAPVLIVVCKEADSKWADFDCAAASQNIMLAAKSLGLGSCSIGTARIMSSMENLKDKLKIPEGYELYIVITLGYPDEEPMMPERKKDNVDWI